MTRFWHANCMTSFRGHRRPLIGRNPKYFTLDFTTHQDHISIDRLKPAIFSTESLNKAPQTPFPHTSCLTKSPDRLAHAHPRTTNGSPDDGAHQNIRVIYILVLCFVLQLYLALLQVYKAFPIDVLVFYNTHYLKL